MHILHIWLRKIGLDVKIVFDNISICKGAINTWEETSQTMELLALVFSNKQRMVRGEPAKKGKIIYINAFIHTKYVFNNFGSKLLGFLRTTKEVRLAHNYFMSFEIIIQSFRNQFVQFLVIATFVEQTKLLYESYG